MESAMSFYMHMHVFFSIWSNVINLVIDDVMCISTSWQFSFYFIQSYYTAILYYHIKFFSWAGMTKENKRNQKTETNLMKMKCLISCLDRNNILFKYVITKFTSGPEIIHNLGPSTGAQGIWNQIKRKLTVIISA